MAQIRVLVVDDSALVRQTLTALLSKVPDIEVVGAAVDPYDARAQIKRLNPDVLTLDVEMPRMDGIQFLRNLMRLRPMPVVMVSTLTEKGAEVTLEALSLGAVDFVSKPKLDVVAGIDEYAEEIVEKVRAAARVRIQALERQRDAASESAPRPLSRGLLTTDKIVAIGSSTGGTEAVREIIERMPPDGPGIVVAQHIPPVFSRSFADRVNSLSAMTVCEAQDGQQILPGHVYVAPGDAHLRVERSGARYRCMLGSDAPVNRHRPSVDALFESVASRVGRNAVGVILTGMGADGAQGLKSMQAAGAPTIAQDEATSVVWGMPGQAVKIGAANEVVPLPAIAERLLALSVTPVKKRA